MGFLAMMARVVHVLVAALWLGAAAVLGLVVGPAVLARVESRQLASHLLTDLGGEVHRFTTWGGPVLLATLLLGWIPLEAKLRLRAGLVVLLSVGAAIEAKVVGPRMRALLEAIGRPFEELAQGDPARAEWANLQMADQALSGAELLLTFLLLVLAIVGTRAHRRGGGIEL